MINVYKCACTFFVLFILILCVMSNSGSLLERQASAVFRTSSLACVQFRANWPQLQSSSQNLLVGRVMRVMTRSRNISRNIKASISIIRSIYVHNQQFYDHMTRSIHLLLPDREGWGIHLLLPEHAWSIWPGRRFLAAQQLARSRCGT